jgi:hypothetical protein
VRVDPWLAAPWLVDPPGIRRGLERVREAGVVGDVPNEWQVGLGILRMWHRVAFRSETIGCSSDPVRPTRGARLLRHRPLRFPFLVAERAIAPFDHSGLLQGPDRMIRHLLAAHHDQRQFAYDLELLALHPGALDTLIARARAIVDGTDPRAAWLRDLVVFEGYHEALLRGAERARRGEPVLEPHEADNPDLSFLAYLAWCARQPPTARSTLRALLRGRRPPEKPVNAEALWTMSRAELADVAAAGHPVDPATLPGRYRGVSLGLPRWVDAALWKVFRKEFRAEGDAVVGHNVRMTQGDDPVPMRTRDGAPMVFGAFRVRPEGRGVLLDYGPTHPRWHPMHPVRDVLVAVRPDSPDLLLGTMYLEVRGVRVSTPSWFTLQREA